MCKWSEVIQYVSTEQSLIREYALCSGLASMALEQSSGSKFSPSHPGSDRVCFTQEVIIDELFSGYVLEIPQVVSNKPLTLRMYELRLLNRM